MLPRFFAPDATAVGVDVALPADEARHLRQVLRLSVGGEVAVFDGRGHEYVARIIDVGRRGVAVRPLSAVEPVPEPQVALTLGVGVLKANRLDNVVRDATMLGVTAIQPLLTARTAVPAAALRRSSVVARWQRVAVASAKQCRRAVVPLVRDAVDFPEFVRNETAGVRLLCVEPSVRVDGVRPLSGLMEQSRPRTAVLVIGSEGGWRDDEVELARAAGFEPLRLGRLTLRAAAVPIVAVTTLRVLWQDW